MRETPPSLLIGFVMTLAFAVEGQAADQSAQTHYGIAFASFAPLDTDVFIADADGSNARPLLAHPDLDYNALFSHDGKWIVFTSRRDGSSDIYRAHADGSSLERLVDHPSFDDQAALSPDGRRLAFVSSRDGQADIWILDIASKSLRNLTQHPAGDFRPSWSPDGEWLAFSSDRDSTRPKRPSGFSILQMTELYVVRANGTNLRRVTKDQAFVGSPAWSPDGRQLSFYEGTLPEVGNITSALPLRGTTQIATVDLQTGERATLTTGTGEKWSPQWLSGGRIGYASGGPEGGIELIAGAAGARGEFRKPSWSADGSRVVFHREVGREWPPHRAWHTLDSQFRLVRTGIFPSYSPSGDRLVSNDKTVGILHNSILMMNADGSGRTVLFGSPGKNALAPAWSRQGDQIAFAFGQFFQTLLGVSEAEIAVVGPDGSGFRMLTDAKSNFGFPSWSRDGRHIVYREASKARNGLRILDVQTGKSRVLLEGTAHYNFPAWSPTSDLIAFTSDADGDYEIYTIRPDGTDLRRLTREPGNDAHNSWSADGEWIAFSTARGGFKDELALHPQNPQSYGEICVMRADGSDVRVLTDDQFEEATPGWMPVRKETTTAWP